VSTADRILFRNPLFVRLIWWSSLLKWSNTTCILFKQSDDSESYLLKSENILLLKLLRKAAWLIAKLSQESPPCCSTKDTTETALVLSLSTSSILPKLQKWNCIWDSQELGSAIGWSSFVRIPDKLPVQIKE